MALKAQSQNGGIYAPIQKKEKENEKIMDFAIMIYMFVLGFTFAVALVWIIINRTKEHYIDKIIKELEIQHDLLFKLVKLKIIVGEIEKDKQTLKKKEVKK